MTAPETRAAKIVTRRAEPADVDALVAVFEEYRAFYRRPSNPAAVTSFLMERLARGDTTIFVAFDASVDEAAGFVQLYPAHSTLRLQSSWILTDLFVAAAHRGQGVARALLRTASEHALLTGASPFSESVSEEAPVRQLIDSLGHRAADWMMQYTIDL